MFHFQFFSIFCALILNVWFFLSNICSLFGPYCSGTFYLPLAELCRRYFIFNMGLESRKGKVLLSFLILVRSMFSSFLKQHGSNFAKYSTLAFLTVNVFDLIQKFNSCEKDYLVST